MNEEAHALRRSLPEVSKILSGSFTSKTLLLNTEQKMFMLHRISLSLSRETNISKEAAENLIGFMNKSFSLMERAIWSRDLCLREGTLVLLRHEDSELCQTFFREMKPYVYGMF